MSSYSDAVSNNTSGLYVPVHRRTPESSPKSLSIDLPETPGVYSIEHLLAMRPLASKSIKEKLLATCPEVVMSRKTRKHVDYVERKKLQELNASAATSGSTTPDLSASSSLSSSPSSPSHLHFYMNQRELPQSQARSHSRSSSTASSPNRKPIELVPDHHHHHQVKERKDVHTQTASMPVPIPVASARTNSRATSRHHQRRPNPRPVSSPALRIGAFAEMRRGAVADSWRKAVPVLPVVSAA